MRSHDVRVYLYDIRAGAEAIEGFTRGKTLDDFLGDLLLRRALKRTSDGATRRQAPQQVVQEYNEKAAWGTVAPM